MLLFVVTMATWQHYVNLQLPTFVPFATVQFSVDEEHMYRVSKYD